MPVLVKFSRDWADEFDISGFVITTTEEVDALKECFSTEQTRYFGTNEGWEDEILIDSFGFFEITDLQAAVINQLFPGGLGYVPYWGEE
ncbi:hypothetical protein FHT44_005153 [Mycolicibacterium sp. BK634]|uniref:hypothetical protein n=1 Tax=Mycolicibacterium sp. BK634 TaxID=2587099 RepID=UPI00161B94D5|nr:hypothetical protein [Mycolicibacterium sp. BK634]MBB3752641.1 hypothetical protein [Mycolicibacterium sp. BK634]